MTPECKLEVCLELLDDFISVCQLKNLKPTLSLFKRRLGLIILHRYAVFSDIILNHYLQIKTYHEFFDIIKNNITLHEGDNPSEFSTNDLIIDNVNKYNYTDLLADSFNSEFKEAYTK